MNSKFYKVCAVPQCNSTTIKTPNKLFIYVPHKPEIRKKWLQLARRDPMHLSTRSKLYFCEDHFDLPNDMQNYFEYHIMGFVSQVLMKPGRVPSKFSCQPNRQKQISTIKRPSILKKLKMKMTIQECLNESIQCSQTAQEGSSSRTSEISSPKNADGKMQVLDNKESNANECISIIETSDLRRSPSEECSGFQCNKCLCIIYGFRYTCVQCSAWELCGQCEQRGAHAHHYVPREPGGATQMESRMEKEIIYASLIPVLRSQTHSEETSVTTQVKEEYSGVAVKEEIIEEDNVENQDLNFYPDSSPHCSSSLPIEIEIKVEYEVEKEESRPNRVHVEQASQDVKVVKSKAEDQNSDSKPIKVRGGKKLIVQNNLTVQQSQSESSHYIQVDCGVTSAHGGTPIKKESAIVDEPSLKPNVKKRKFV